MDQYPCYTILKCPKSNKIKVRDYCVHASGQQYSVFNYDSDYICFDESSNITQYRSIIMNYPQRHLLSFSPPRGNSINTFHKQYSAQDDDIYVNEMIEGTLVHLFYDARISSWEIATKSAVGGYYQLSEKNVGRNRKQLTVREMFLEALCYSSTTLFSQVTLFAHFSKHYSYNFILQHPSNPIILHPAKPCLYLVAVYDITSKDRRAISIPAPIFQHWDSFSSAPILFPKTFHVQSWDEITGKMGLFNRTSFEYMGCIATHLGTGERCVMQNPVYDDIRKMRKVNPGLFYQFLCLHRTNSLDAYLQYYPRFRRKFQQFHSMCNEFIDLAHTHYLARYVWRNCNIISPKYAPYIDAIHREIYLPSLKIQKTIITRKVIRKYLFSLSPNEILYALQYEKRDDYQRRLARLEL
jgi:hypothetical protein